MHANLLEQIKIDRFDGSITELQACFWQSSGLAARCVIDIVGQASEGYVGPRSTHHEIGDFSEIGFNWIAHLIQAGPVRYSMRDAAFSDVGQFGNHSYRIRVCNRIL